MRISDWSSDVCSSDLRALAIRSPSALKKASFLMAMCVMIPGMVGSVTDMAIPHALVDALDSTRTPNNKKVSYLTRITLDGFLRWTGFMARIDEREVDRLKEIGRGSRGERVCR